MVDASLVVMVLCLLSLTDAYKPSHNSILTKITAFVFSAALLSSSTPTSAQIPSMDDFYTTSGTVIKPKDIVPPTEDTSLNSLSDFKEVLKKLEVLSANEKWDDVISIDNKIKKVLSISSESIFPKGIKDDVLFDIASLDDLSIQNRITYFSKEDLKQISGLIRDNGDVKVAKNDDAIKEALQIIQDIRQLLN